MLFILGLISGFVGGVLCCLVLILWVGGKQ